MMGGTHGFVSFLPICIPRAYHYVRYLGDLKKWLLCFVLFTDLWCWVLDLESHL